MERWRQRKQEAYLYNVIDTVVQSGLQYSRIVQYAPDDVRLF